MNPRETVTIQTDSLFALRGEVRTFPRTFHTVTVKLFHPIIQTALTDRHGCYRVPLFYSSAISSA